MNPEKDRIGSKKGSRWYRVFFNKYLIFSAAFVVWMLFFDQNSYLIHRELDKELRELKKDRNLYEGKLENEQKQILMMKEDSGAIEKVAREKHFLSRENEDVFIIEEKNVRKSEPMVEPEPQPEPELQPEPEQEIEPEPEPEAVPPILIDSL